MESVLNQLRSEAFELRHDNANPLYFEAVYKQTKDSDLILNIERFFGTACLAPGQVSTYPKIAKKCIKNLGGIRENQFFYFKQIDDSKSLYAAIWPWESNISMMTLKLGEYSPSFLSSWF